MLNLKKVMALGLSMLFTFGLTACGGDSSTKNSEGGVDPIESTNSKDSNTNNESSTNTENSDSSDSSTSTESTSSSESSEEVVTKKEYTRITYFGTEKEDGDYILFGSYPQRYVSNNKTIEALNAISEVNSLGYIEYEGEQYVKITATLSKTTEYMFTSGKVVNGQECYFKVEPIRWKILEVRENGTALLLSESILDARAYQSEYSVVQRDGDDYYYNTTLGTPENTKANNYEHSEIRKFLNGEFLNKAFLEEQKGIIKKTIVDNSLESTLDNTNVNICNNTEDKVFLLSTKEATSESYDYRDVDNHLDVRQKKGTQYAITRGLWEEYDKNSCWWLRSPAFFVFGKDAKYYLVVGNTPKYNNVDYQYYGVSPAINITL